jgi:hypothetical protein
MRLFDKNGKKIFVYKSAYKPKMGRGKKVIWYEADIIIDNNPVTVHWECARGAKYYFTYEGELYFIPFHVLTKQWPFIEQNIEIDLDNDISLTTC